MVVIGDDDALAPDPVGRRQLRSQIRIADVSPQTEAHHRLEGAHPLGLLEPERDALAVEVLAGASGTLQHGQAPIDRTLEAGDAPIEAREDPRGRPLEDE